MHQKLAFLSSNISQPPPPIHPQWGGGHPSPHPTALGDFGASILAHTALVAPSALVPQSPTQIAVTAVNKHKTSCIAAIQITLSFKGSKERDSSDSDVSLDVLYLHVSSHDMQATLAKLMTRCLLHFYNTAVTENSQLENRLTLYNHHHQFIIIIKRKERLSDPSITSSRLRAEQNNGLTRSGERDHFQFVVVALKLYHAWSNNNLVLVSKLWINGKNAFTAAHTKLYCTRRNLVLTILLRQRTW